MGKGCFWRGDLAIGDKRSYKIHNGTLQLIYNYINMNYNGNSRI